MNEQENEKVKAALKRQGIVLKKAKRSIIIFLLGGLFVGLLFHLFEK